MNTLELSLLEACDERDLAAAVVAFVRRTRRLPKLEDLEPEAAQSS